MSFFLPQALRSLIKFRIKNGTIIKTMSFMLIMYICWLSHIAAMVGLVLGGKKEGSTSVPPCPSMTRHLPEANWTKRNGRAGDRNPDLPQICEMQSGRSTTEPHAQMMVVIL